MQLAQLLPELIPARRIVNDDSLDSSVALWADFVLFRLIPDGGLYVRGFGQAFEVSPNMKNSKHLTGNSLVREPIKFAK
jgi:hypothetical protein